MTTSYSTYLINHWRFFLISSEFRSVFLFSEVFLVSCRVFSEPSYDIIVFTTFVVIDSGLVVSRVEFESRISTDFNTFSFVDGGIKVSDDNIRSSNVFSNLNPLGSKRFAMSTPGGVVFNKNVLGGVVDDFIVLDTNNSLNGTIV